ncbi:hypothetical protein ABMA27_016991 [Loxostege sticticalis]|uniref:115 kDa protein in type-1 retrotransposable element R1DM n=1 Tax=Loxostege sticticalis TaxID=481309 RepID=A0ABR3GYI1_LOXSC
MALIQEPYIGNTGTVKSYPGVRILQCARKTDKVIKAAIAVFDDTVPVTLCPTLTTENVAVAVMGIGAHAIGMISVYLEGDADIEPDLVTIGRAIEGLDTAQILMGGDFNAWSCWWGSKSEDHRGEAVMGAFSELGLHILNEGTAPTFETYRAGKRFASSVDITVCSENMLGRVKNWHTDSDVTTSDHRAILFEISTKITQNTVIKSTTRKYNTKKASWVEFREKLSQLNVDTHINLEDITKINNKQELEKIVETYTNNIIDSCRTYIPEKKHKKRMGLPWWTDELTEKKKHLKTARRRIAAASQTRRAHVVKLYVEAREEYHGAIRSAQTRSWKDFCSKQDRETMWDSIYRVIGRTATVKDDAPLVKEGRALTNLESAKLLAATFYPPDTVEDDSEEHKAVRELASKVNDRKPDEASDPPFTREELQSSLESFNPKKAPGGDGLTADICGAAVNTNPVVFLAMINKCLELACFPKIWKEAVVVILRKSGKEDYTHPKSFRPIGLLPVLGKIFEKMMVRRIRWHTLPSLSPHQYGFTPQRSTEDSLYVMMRHIRERLAEGKIIVLVSLDIEGAFDSAWWPAIKLRLAETNCPSNIRRLVDSYLEDRRVSVRYAGEEANVETTKGCVQGSIGGPTFWNLLLDPLLKELEERGDRAQAFADDVVLIFSGHNAIKIQAQANRALGHVQRWGTVNKLKFAPQKTKAMLITRKLKHDTPHLHMAGQPIGYSRKIKILGLTIDEKLTFNDHVSSLCQKAAGISKQLTRAAKVSWGLNPEVVRAIYVAVVEPVIMYAASAWAPASSKLGTIKQLSAVQRGLVQKILKAYKTVSLNSALLLAGLLPLDIRIREAALLYEVKKGYSTAVVGDRDVERQMDFSKTPHPAELRAIDFDCVHDEAELLQHEQTNLKIYTDGSKIEGKVGAAVSIWDNGAEIVRKKLVLERFCTVYQAEMLALSRAVQMVLRRGPRAVDLYSDSRSALEAVTRGNSTHPLAVQLRSDVAKIAHKGGSLALHWIKAHVGLAGNERADELAKEAALNSKTRADYDACPISHIKGEIRSASLDEWNRRYTESATATTTKIFFPDAIKAYRVVRKIDLDPNVVQILTGHGGFSEYLNRFKCKESPACPCDAQTPETVAHILVECPRFALKRLNLENKIGAQITVANIKDIMMEKPARAKLIEYCKEICILVNKGNRA